MLRWFATAAMALLWAPLDSPAIAAPPAVKNPTGLTAAMIAPCDQWLAIRNGNYESNRPLLGLSNLDYALSIPPYESALGPYSLKSTRETAREWEEVVRIMERRDRAGMIRVIGIAYDEEREYLARLAGDYRFLCMLYVRRKQLSGAPFGRRFPSPASVGITPEFAEKMRRGWK